MKITYGARVIAKERDRQKTEEEWTSEHDDEHDGFELTRAAASYALHVVESHGTLDRAVDRHVVAAAINCSWPWESRLWNPSGPDDIEKQLAKAGALIAAELDRLHRRKL